MKSLLYDRVNSQTIVKTIEQNLIESQRKKQFDDISQALYKLSRDQ
jgi:hypothetical protein